MRTLIGRIRGTLEGWVPGEDVDHDDVVASLLIEAADKLEEATTERRVIVKGWKTGDYNRPGRREFVSTHHHATEHDLEIERARIGEEGLPDWQPHITEVYMEEREITEWRRMDL